MGDDTVSIPGHRPERTVREARRFNPDVGCAEGCGLATGY